MKKILLIGSLLILTACGEKPRVITEIHQIPVKPPEDLFVCERYKYKTFEGMTQKDVAAILIKNDEAFATCQANMNAIKEFSDKAETIIERKESVDK